MRYNDVEFLDKIEKNTAADLSPQGVHTALCAPFHCGNNVFKH